MTNVYKPIFAHTDKVLTHDAGDQMSGKRSHMTYRTFGAYSASTTSARGLHDYTTPYHLHIGVREADLHRLADTANPFTGEVLPFYIQNDSWTEWGESREDDVHHVLIEAEQLESAVEYVNVMMRDILVPWDGSDEYNPKGMICVATSGEQWDDKYEEGDLYA